MKLLSKIHDEIFQLDDTVWLQRYIRKGCRVLELGCGPGRVLSFLETQDVSQVVGLENNPFMLEAANSRFGNSDTVKIHKRDFSKDWGLEGKFDLILCMANTITMLTADHEWKELFNQISHYLTEDGKFLFWLRTDARSPQEKYSKTVIVDGIEYHFDYEFQEDFAERRRNYLLKVLSQGQFEKNTIVTKLISAKEVRILVDATSLRLEGLYEDVDATPYTVDSKWLYAVVGRMKT